ncbi:MAG TPA: DUF1501 domain-containing protein [Planctomycetaceae bacterium]|nr:DUF1501 domain-containing protein [Planctomycetaceae bacterium]
MNERTSTSLSPSAHFAGARSRRDFLSRAGGGFGALALYSLLVEEGVFPRVANAGEDGAPHDASHQSATKARSLSPLAARPGHFAGSATSVIFLFMDGGPSHLDTFDHKPKVNEYAGKPLPDSIERVVTPMGISNNPLLPSQRQWTRHGASGIEISDWYPHLAKCADELCLVRSCWADGLNHVGSVCQMNTGSVLAGRPSLGAWVGYGLGTENQNLPGFVVLLDNDREPPGGNRVWGTGFMPATFQGTRFRNGKTPVLHLDAPEELGQAQQRHKLDYINQLNRAHLASRAGDFDLEARIAAYELAFRMQAETPAAVDLAQETRATQELYGLDDKTTSAFGRNCLLARRLVERGVRFVQLYSGSGSQWDAHAKIEENHSRLCRSTDKPIAGLLTDLKARGLLERTLVVWGGEFGRTPMSEKGDGRDHNPYGFTMWMAGGGVARGKIVGATDDFGLKAVERRVHVRDLHATILDLLGLDHTQLIYLHQGRPERPTVNEGRVIDDVFA